LWGPGRSAPVAAITAAQRRGVDLRDHRSQLVTPALSTAADLILVMDARQRTALRFDHGVADAKVVVLGDLDPVPIPARPILHPVARPGAPSGRSSARLERGAAALLELLTPGAGRVRHQMAAARA